MASPKKFDDSNVVTTLRRYEYDIQGGCDSLDLGRNGCACFLTVN